MPPKRPPLDVPHFHVDFTTNRVLNRDQPFEVLVRQREYMHDGVVLRFNDRNIDMRRGKYRHGQPVILKFGYRRNLETFVGYVHSTKVFTNRGPKQLEVYLVAPSYRCNKTRQRTFTGIRVGDIVKKIATEHKLAFKGDVSLRVYGKIEQARGGYLTFPQLGRSDWNMMVALAKDVGFTLDCHRTTVRFRKRDIITNPKVEPPTWRAKTPSITGGSQLFDFKLQAGSAPLAKNRRLVMGGVGDDGKPFYATDPKDKDCCERDGPVFTEYYLDPATSIHAGRKALSGLSGMSRYYVQATARVSGHPHVRSGEMARLLEVGKELLGYWWIGQVDHDLRGTVPGRPAHYYCTLTIGRESVEQTVCVDAPPKKSWSGKDEVVDPCGPRPERTAPVLYSPEDDCAPLEKPAKACTCRKKSCPGSKRPLPTRTTIAPRFDLWRAKPKRTPPTPRRFR